MNKTARELCRMAEEAGVRRPRVIGGCPHGRLVGYVGSRAVSMVVSLNQALSYARARQQTKANLRRLVRGEAPR